MLDLRNGIGGLMLSKVASILVTFASGFATYVATEISTQNLWIGLTTTAIATVFVGLLTNWPRWMKARADGWTSLIREMRTAHGARIIALERQVAFHSRERAISRATKHTLAGFLQPAYDRIRELEALCRDHNVQFEPFTRANVASAFAEEDQAMKQLTQDQVNEAITRPAEE